MRIYRSYVIRCWKRAAPRKDGATVERFVVERISDDARRWIFGDFDELVSFLKQELLSGDEGELVIKEALMSDQMVGLRAAASPETTKWAVVFDFDTDSCYPAPAVSQDGQMNGGLDTTGHITGGCRDKAQLTKANTYCRTLSITKDSVTYSVYMYALYFQKDQGDEPLSPLLFSITGHRHDWEYALVWVKDNALTHASVSAHGKVTTEPIAALSFDADKTNTVKVVYHKGSILGYGTHSFRFAKPGEKAENETKEWLTPALAQWDQMYGAAVSNEQLQQLFNNYDYGKANCSFNDWNFPSEIAKNPPSNYPSGDEWKNAAHKAPSTPNGLITRWLVLPARDADRDDQQVNLLKGQRAKLVVYLPEPARTAFRFNLKHDKHGTADRGRTPIIGNGDIVSGDDQDWPSFRKRIYLGERQGEDQGFKASPGGFYVDLILVP